MPSIFTKILNKEIPSEILYEDDICFVIKDIAPHAPVHLLIIPKKEIQSISYMEPGDESIVGHLFVVAKKMGEEFSLSGYKLLFNVNEAGGQEVMHLHLHLMGGARLSMPEMK